MALKLKFIAIFVVGFLLGGAATGWGIHHCFKKSWANRNNAEYLLNRLSSKLDLTPDQKEKVSALLKEELPKTEALRKEVGDKFKVLAEDFNSRLKPILNLDQQKKWDTLCDHWKSCSSGKGFLPGCGGPASMGLNPLPMTIK